MSDKLLVINVERNYWIEPERALWIDIGVATLEGEVLAETHVELHASVPVEYGGWGSGVMSAIDVVRASSTVEHELLEFIDTHFGDTSNVTTVLTRELWALKPVLARFAPSVASALEDRFVDFDEMIRIETDARKDAGISMPSVADTIEETVSSILQFMKLLAIFGALVQDEAFVTLQSNYQEVILQNDRSH